MAKKRGRTVKVDFTNVQEGGAVRIKEGDYRVKIKNVELGDSKSGNSMLTFTYEFLEGKAKGKPIKDRIVLQDNVLWRLRNLLTALGKKVPKKAVNLNIDELIGEEFAVSIVDGEEYNNRIRSEVSDYISLEDFEEEDEEEEEDEDEDDDEEEEDEDEDLEEIDVEDL